MRQKIRLAQAIAHHPRVLVLDEPLNGLDPMARAESLALFEELGRQGMHLVISSHILDEVDRISDRVVLITGGYLVAEGSIHQVRKEVRDKPMQVLVRCDKPELLASKMFEVNHCVEARLHADGQGVFLRTGDVDQFYRLINEIAVEGLVKIQGGGSGRRRRVFHLPVPDRIGRGNGAMTEQATTYVRLLMQQPWSLWWMQARRLVRIEVRRNLLSKRAWWIYFLAFVPTVIIFLHLLIERHPQFGMAEDTWCWPGSCSSITCGWGFSLDVWEYFRGSFAAR